MKAKKAKISVTWRMTNEKHEAASWRWHQRKYGAAWLMKTENVKSWRRKLNGSAWRGVAWP